MSETELMEHESYSYQKFVRMGLMQQQILSVCRYICIYLYVGITGVLSPHRALF